MDPTWTSVSFMEICTDSDLPVCVCCWLAGSFLLGSPTKDKHIKPCKYRRDANITFTWMDPPLDICINITGTEGEKKKKKQQETQDSRTHLSVSELTVKLTLMISLPSGHRQAGRAGTSTETVNRTRCLFPSLPTSALTGQQICSAEIQMKHFWVFFCSHFS